MLEENTKLNDLLTDFRLKLWNVYATIFQLSGYDSKQLKEKEDVMVDFITLAYNTGHKEALDEMDIKLLDLNDAIFKEYKQAVKENDDASNGYAHSLAMVKDLANVLSQSKENLIKEQKEIGV